MFRFCLQQAHHQILNVGKEQEEAAEANLYGKKLVTIPTGYGNTTISLLLLSAFADLRGLRNGFPVTVVVT